MRWQIVARYITLCPLKITRDSQGVASYVDARSQMPQM